jgi:hypothetical protein
LGLETSSLSASATNGDTGSSPRITEVSDKERIRMTEPGAQPLRPVSNLRELSTAKKPVPRIESPSAMQRTAGFMRTALPLLQKMLPLLDGNVASVVASLLAPRPQGPAVDLRPVEGALGKIHTEHVELRKRVEDQNTSLKRMSDQLDLVKESTERHTLEQKEVAEDLHKLRKRVTIFAWVGLALLLISIAVNVILAFEVEGALR